MFHETKWNKQFNIGIDSIDNAHRRLFSIVGKLIHLSRDENNGQWACAEGIKYFKNYAIEHFADEEAYMQSICYKEYGIHKRLHDDMRYETLPALEKDLTESNYSQESIQHFLGICLGWLTAHIMIEDRAITGKVSTRWKADNAGIPMDTLKNALLVTVQEIFRLKTEIVSEHYSGENFGPSLVIRLTYLSKDKETVQIFIVLENSLVLKTVSAMLNMPLKKMDKIVMNAAKELSQHIAEQLGAHNRLSSQYELENSHIVAMDQFKKIFYSEGFDYSLLLDAGHSYLAFCVKLD
ncbi:bacteriohemerythrin [Roseburia sp. 1XD42-69]|uniref:bacteriohemerythrin n=1 Tax=Roseburia sp. 1XD42-69 TaxID=2320088 RepID=UPI000EA17539|nr:hemerythrin family protein [Roseburia sp. 1XD42-69]RKJ66846.1 hypothetical protein D7Y06_06840 [Roseburia sp. 1XD42-69]